MPDIWTQTGQGDGVLVDSAGLPWYCTSCPCVNVQDVIKERQIAQGITLAWSSGDPTNTARLIGTPAEKSDYTLTQLKAYVNAIATSYLDGEYTGGAGTPVLLTNAYADGATTTGELLVLVLAMLETNVAASSEDSTYFQGDYFGPAFGGDCSTAKSSAESDYQSEADQAIAFAATSLAWGGANQRWMSLTAAGAGKSQVSGMATTIDHVVKIYGLAEVATPSPPDPGPAQSQVFSKHGRAVADENEYGLMSTSGTISGATYNTGDLLSTSRPTTWPACPLVNNQNSLGFVIDTWTAVITWSFTAT